MIFSSLWHNWEYTMQAVNLGRQLFSADHHLWFRLFKAFLFLGVLSIIFTLSNICDLSLMDLIVCCLAFFPTGWGLILVSLVKGNFFLGTFVLDWSFVNWYFILFSFQIAQAARPKIENTGLWYFIRVLAKAFDYGMGVVLLAPIAILAWLPIISAFQTRFLFNEAYRRHLQIKPILAGKKKQK